jgi:CRP-like cAMP-binding protein
MRKALYVLGILDDIDIEWLVEHGTVQYLPARKVLVREGDAIDSLYILLDGHLRITVGGEPGFQIADLYPGEIIGEISFVDSRPPSASVTATEDSQVFAISRTTLSTKLLKDHGFAERFYHSVARFLADRLWVTTGRFGYGSPQQDVDPDEVEDSSMEEISLAAVRFDKFLKQLRGHHAVGVTVA